MALMRTMPIREFLRGGYQDLEEATVVMRHGQPMFTVAPYRNAAERPRTSRNGGISAQNVSERRETPERG